MRILVIGGTGLTGMAMAPRLANAGHEVFLLARGLTPVPDAVRVRLVVADRSDPSAFDNAYRGINPDVVIDQVAFRGEDVDQVASLRPDRHLVCSSAAVLGAGVELDEDAPVPTPATAYLAGKIAVEQRARLAAAIVLRPAYLYGPGHAPMTLRGRDPLLVERLRAGDTIELPDDGALAVQPVYAADFAAAVAAILRESHPAPLYHVAGPATTWYGWMAALAAAAGAALRVRTVAADELTATSVWFRDYLRHVLTIRSTRLAPIPFTPLDDGARALVAWLDRRGAPGQLTPPR